MKTKKNTRRSPKRQRLKKKQKKRTYRLRNWKEYNASLVQRGSLTVWVEQRVLDNWINQQPSGGRGASQTYSDLAMLTALTFGWLTWYRRLSKDYEQRVEASESFVYVAMIHLMLRRLHPQPTS